MNIPRRLGPKRASKIRKLFNLSKEDDVRHYVVKRPLPKKEGKKRKYAVPKVTANCITYCIQFLTSQKYMYIYTFLVSWILVVHIMLIHRHELIRNEEVRMRVRIERELASRSDKVFYGQEPPSGESTTTECGVNYQLPAIMY